tara:strand:+ start:347 stop:472 length:126 start_codon:yes stop_codon:yes gene_type:complete
MGIAVVTILKSVSPETETVMAMEIAWQKTAKIYTQWLTLAS